MLLLSITTTCVNTKYYCNNKPCSSCVLLIMSVATTTTTATDPSRPSIDLVTSSCCMVRSLSRCGSMSTTRPLIKISLHNDKDVKILKDRLHNKELLIFLDYDGTLTPIVSNPGDAKLSSQM